MAGEMKPVRLSGGHNFLYTSIGAVNMNAVSAYEVTTEEDGPRVKVYLGAHTTSLGGEEARLFLKFAGDQRYRI